MRAQIQLAPIVVVSMSVQDCRELHELAKLLNQSEPVVKRLVEITEHVLTELQTPFMGVENGRNTGPEGSAGRHEQKGEGLGGTVGFTQPKGVHPKEGAGETAGYL